MEKGVFDKEKSQRLFEQMADLQKEMLAHTNTEKPLKPEFIWQKLGPNFKRIFDQLIEEASKRGQVEG